MSQQNAPRFAVLLSQAIHEIKRIESRSIAFIQDEIGYAMGRKGGSVIESWRKGEHMPQRKQDVEQLASILVQRGKMPQAWLEEYLVAAGYRREELDAFTRRLFPLDRKGSAVERDGQLTGMAGHSLAQPRIGGALPIPPSPLVDRVADLAYLAELLANPACHLITITGPGGIGKTRLALEAAVQQLERFAQGAIFVDLSGVTDASALPAAILATLAIPLQGRQSPSRQLRAVLQGLELLVVLDNYEQLLPDVELLTEFVRQVPGIKWLVTSRERLALRAEHLLELTGLSYPQRAQSPFRLEPAEVATQYPAIQLFLQRVRQTQHRFTATAEDIGAMVRICQVTEGMPLALELAATAVRTRSCAAIAAGLENGRLRLTTNLRDLPERHLSVDSAFEYSWRLLAHEERQVFCRLAVFRGGFLAGGAQTVAGASLEILAALIDKSLIYLQREPSGSFRYAMHELTRQYAEEKLIDTGDLATTHLGHLKFFVELAEEAESKLTSREQRQWLDQLEREHDNLRIALERAITHQWHELAIRLAAALSRFWFIRAHVDEGRTMLERICGLPQFAASTNHSRAAAKSLIGAGWLAFLQGDYAQAVPKFECGLAVAQSLQDAQAGADALRGLALQAMNQGDPALAQNLAQQSLDAAHTAGDPWLAGAALNVLGELARTAGDYQAAAILFEQSQLQLEAAGDSSRLIIAQFNAGWVALALGQTDRAMALQQQVVRLANAIGHVRAVALGLDGIASVLVRSSLLDQVKLGAQLLGAADAIRQRANILLERIDRANCDQCISMAKSRLHRDSFASAWAEGQGMTLDQAVAICLRAQTSWPISLRDEPDEE